MTPDPTEDVTGSLVEERGRTWYRIDGVDRMDPFLTTVVSDVDLWMFVSSAGPLTAGRVDADHAWLPYETDDRLHRSAGIVGPVTVLAREIDGRREVWRPFLGACDDGCSRSLDRSALGSAIAFEERNERWGVDVRIEWTPAPTYGWVRTVELADRGGRGATVEVLDGLLDVMPAGVDALIEQTRSNLVDAYKRSETVPEATAAVYALESLITDRAEPAETLAATLLWAHGLDGAEVHLDEEVVAAVLAGEPFAPSSLRTGQRTAYLLRSQVEVPADGSVTWLAVADIGLGHAALHDRLELAGATDAPRRVADDVAAGEQRLHDLLAGADAFQATADPVADAHHLSNVRFNAMRGGVFPYGYTIPTGDLADFLAGRNREVHERHAGVVADRGAEIALADLHALADDLGDPHLVRLVLEYLPLTFSRRHGDPSRPWNRFSIRVTTDDGSELLTYEGNWRDIFQNWEALLRSYPRFYPHVVAKFVNASTLDGHNPYRISRDGIDWEVPDPSDPWSNIGYWGDHQIVYLLRLLEGWRDVAPDELAGWLDRAVFSYADVPYRLAGHDAMIMDPRNTITFDEDRDARIRQRVERVGADGRLVTAHGETVHVTLAEKLLVPALAKLSSYVPGAGIWMNTQRPEWNDANNALAGYGASLVTLCYLERYLAFVGEHLGAGGATHRLSRPVATWLAAVADALEQQTPDAASDPAARRGLLDAVGRAGGAHRQAVADSFDTATTEVPAAEVARLVTVASEHLQASIRRARRSDGAYHAYNLIAFPDADTVTVEHLPLMLEGQVAVATTTALDAREVVELVDALFDSALYRADQQTFMLYPVPDLEPFLERNTIPADVVDRVPVLRSLVGPGGAVEQDADGGLHFRPGLPNVEALREALSDTDLDPDQRAAVEEVYEDLFGHHRFTGRSGGMHGYEGIGSIYWHMVSKLLLAVQERHARAVQAGEGQVVEQLAAAYRRIRDGLGFRKDPATFGAIPLDCYSHTPAHAGAQQPGMTGQVKEEVLTRPAELGLEVRDGRLRTSPPLLPREEVLGAADSARCTVCGVPVRLLAAAEDRVRVVRTDGTTSERAGDALTRGETDAVLARTGEVAEIEFLTRW